MKVCVVGLGAVGGVLAGWLALRLPAGQLQLSALARGATLQAVQQHGLRLQQDGVENTVALRASDSPAALGPQDLVVVAVKAHAMPAAAAAVAALCGPHTLVLTAMNGVPWWFFEGGVPAGNPCAGLALKSVDPAGDIRRLVPASRVLGGVVHFSSTSPTPGVVQHGSGNRLIVGRATGPADPVLHAVASLLAAAGIEVTVSEHIQRDLWFKLWGNMTMNPVSALTGAASDRLLEDPLVRQYMSEVMKEAQAIGAAFGVPIDQQPDERHAVTRRLGSFRTSMLQDAQAGRPLEIDALLGAVREIGQHQGRATPFMDSLLGLVRLMARERGLYPPQPQPQHVAQPPQAGAG